ncbi:MAG: hypothetical protein GXP62_15350 [Oligoflexia bacterium]|nr:hypothetical protein [Oligoflexia bacterium]
MHPTKLSSTKLSLPKVLGVLALFSAGTLITGCEIAPSYVSSADVDDALARKQYKTMCVGLSMKDDDVRRYTTERFETIADFNPPDPKGVEAGRACVCEHILDKQGRIDLSIARGLKSTDRDDMVQCLVDAIADPAVPHRADAVQALSRTAAKTGRDALAKLAQDDADAAIRLVATKAIAGNSHYQDVLLKLATTDADDEIRGAAIAGLARLKGEAVTAALHKLATDDKAGSVRGAALQALKTARAEGIDDMLCKAMMDDPSPDVRVRAVMAFRGTKRDSIITCLRNRALTKEDDSGVRDAVLTVLKSSPSQKAADVLCDAIPFWMRSYVIDDLPDKIPGTDIAKAQNDRDWENSFTCMQKAYRSSRGYSCYAKMYTAWWFRQVGGTAYVPKCPKYEE